MKVLVSAYACSPYRGSEPGVGWAAVCRIADKHEVLVLTGSRARSDLERAIAEGVVPKRVRIVHMDEPVDFHPNRFVARLQNWLRYRSFNKRILRKAIELHEKEDFDLCHQVTIAAWRMPSPLWQLPIPFVWGPIGGAGEIPGSFRSMLRGSAKFFEWLRDVNTRWISGRKGFLDCMKNSAHVFAANDETLEFLEPFRTGMPITRLPIASISAEKASSLERPQEEETPPKPLKLFAGGNMEGRKGGTLALQALGLLGRKGVDFSFTIAGGGPDIPHLKLLARSLGIEKQVKFHQGFSGDDYRRILKETDVYFLPSFRESTPVTLLEACLAGAYPVVADTSAQGEIVKLVGGSAIPAKSPGQLVSDMAEELEWCDKNRDKISSKGREAAKHVAREFSASLYDQAIDQVYSAVTR